MSQFLAGMLQEARGDFAGSADALRHAYLIDQESPTLLRALARSALHAGDAEAAIRYATRGLEADPADARLRFLRASIRQAMGQHESALPDLEAAAEVDTSNAEYALAAARQYDRLNRLREARASYERAFRHSDPDPEDELRLAVVLGRMGLTQEAMPLLDRLREESPDTGPVALTWAWVADDLGRHADAVPVYEKHLQARPDDRLVRRRLVNALVALDRVAQAVPHAENLWAAGENLTDARLLASLYLRQDQQDKARDLALDVDRREPADWAAATFAVSLLGRANESGKAISLARKKTESHAGDYRSWLLYATALTQAERKKDAVAALGRARSILPDSAGAFVEMGRTLSEAGETAPAESAFFQALDRGADSAATWYDIAGAREKRKDFAGAEAAIQEVLRLQPDNAQALNFLGYLYADYDRKTDRAVPLLKRALELDPGNGFIMDSLGWAYYRLGVLDSARTELERAIKTSGEDPTILEHLGDVYVAMNLHSEAKASYRRALELKPENPPLRAKLEKLR